VLCFQPFGFCLLRSILEEQLRGQNGFCETMLLGEQTCVTTLPMVIPVTCLPAEQADGTTLPTPSPRPSQPCHNPASNRFPSGSAPLLPTGVWRKTGPGLRHLHSAARSQHGGTSYRCMPRMPKRTAPKSGLQRCKSKGARYELGYYHLKISFSMVTALTQGHFPAKPPLLPPWRSLLPPPLFFLLQACYIKRENENI